MNKYILLLLLLVSSTLPAWADNFQITYAQGKARYSAGYTSVKVFNTQNRLVFNGATDRYGRIIITLPIGSYRVEVSLKSGTVRRNVVINNSRVFRNIDL